MNKEEMMSQIAKMECEIKHFKKELNKQEKPKRRWKPVFGERYWFIDGNTFYTDWDEAVIDNYRYAIGNVFKTQEEADFAREQLKVLAELKEYADGEQEWNGNNEHKCIIYDTSQKCFDIVNYISNINTPFNLYFSSEKQAQKAIDAIGEEKLKKYYFCVEE